jgi:hypothetical protein
MISYLYDETARVVRTFDDGVEIETRPYSPEEIAAADAAIAARGLESNREALIAKARQALNANATYLALASPTNAQNLAQIRLLTREATALIRLTIGALETTDGT